MEAGTNAAKPGCAAAGRSLSGRPQPGTAADPYGLLSVLVQAAGAPAVTVGDLLATLQADQQRFSDSDPLGAGSDGSFSPGGDSRFSPRTGKPRDAAHPLPEKAAGPAGWQTSWEKCPECLCQMKVRGLEFVCPLCARVSEGPLESEISACEGRRFGVGGTSMVRSAPRLRVVGPGSSYYQRDLDRNTTVDYSDTQRRYVLQELHSYNMAYRESGHNPFPVNVLQMTADAYSQVQQQFVKRSQMKQTILAAILYHMCIKAGFARDRGEVAEFAQLRTHGIAKGDDFLRSLQADNLIDLDVNADCLDAYIVTAFARLRLIAERTTPRCQNEAAEVAIQGLQRAVRGIVVIAVRENIGTQSVLRSKVIAGTYEVLRRAGGTITLGDVVDRCTIRRNTITRFTTKLAEYHSHFEAVYREHCLEHSRRCLVRRPPGGPKGGATTVA